MLNYLLFLSMVHEYAYYSMNIFGNRSIARKSLKMTDFSKNGSRNMAETCAINFLTLVSYSTSIVIGGLRQLLLAVLMWAGAARNGVVQFWSFFQVWSLMEYRSRSVVVWSSTVLFLAIAFQQSAVSSPHLGCVFVQRRRRAEPTSPYLVASDQKRQILSLFVSP